MSRIRRIYMKSRSSHSRGRSRAAENGRKIKEAEKLLLGEGFRSEAVIYFIYASKYVHSRRGKWRLTATFHAMTLIKPLSPPRTHITQMSIPYQYEFSLGS